MGYEEFRGVPLATGYELITAWINRQKKNEFNPLHTHDGELSFVTYTQIPELLEIECRLSVGNSPGPGCITFDFNMPGSNVHKLFLQTHSHLPAVGDMFIFPAWLKHWVSPFNTDCVRVSVSGNVHDSAPLNQIKKGNLKKEKTEDEEYLDELKEKL